MAPIRLALIGLSQNAKTSWASGGHLPYLLSERGRQRYQIAGLLNSSVDAAQRAIQAYKLGPDTKAYESPEHLAADPDIDLVVCATRVDNHYDGIKPSLAAGKAVFVEWPVAENKTRVAELTSLAKEKGVPTIVGLQARVSPAVLKVKEILKSGRLGKVLSSSVQGYAPHSGRDTISEGLGYFLDKKVGGNPMTIALAHMLDYVHSVLGEYTSFSSHAQIQRAQQSIVNAQTGSGTPWTSDVPDLLSVHGTLAESAHVAPGASLVVAFRTGPPFPGTKPLVWTVNCEHGEIRLSSSQGPYLQAEASAGEIPIEIDDFRSGQLQTVDWAFEPWQLPMSARGRNIGKLYDLYSDGRLAQEFCADIFSAERRHQELEAMLYGE